MGYPMDNVNKIIIIDDNANVLLILSDALKRLGYDCDAARDGYEGLEKINRDHFDLVLSDIKMTKMDSLEFLRRVKTLDPDLPVVMVSAVRETEVVRRALREGAYDYLTKPFGFEELEITLKRAFERGRLLRENREYQRDLEKRVRERTRELMEALREVEDTYRMTLESLIEALDAREHETSNHSQRVTSYTLSMAIGMAVGEEDLTQISRGSILHDVGKIGVPDSILLKKGRLTKEEWNIMKKHPEIGYEILKGIKFIGKGLDIVLFHHERYDGKGYPKGLADSDIPLGARIFPVADALDAMTSDRPYRKGLPFAEAREEIRKHSGSQFDPRVVEVFTSIPEEEWERMRSASPSSPTKDKT